MSIIKISVRWSGKKYDVEVNTEDSGEVLKHLMFSLTGVEPERQKILIKGKTLKDEDSLSNFSLVPNQILMMMGTIGEVLKVPEKPIKFLEDMTYEEIAKKMEQPSGLTNLGNTCYVSATVQSLLAIKELVKGLNENEKENSSSDAKTKLTYSLRDLFNLMNKKEGTVMPLVFLNDLRTLYPNFAQKDEQFNIYKQQDAEECWSGILSAIDHGLKVKGVKTSFVNDYLRGEMKTTYSCDEAPEEPATETSEIFSKLDCRIDKSVNYLQQGLKLSLIQKITKSSPTLNRNAEYTATSTITRLPMYLTIDYLRFFWKAKESIDAKIVKSVKFPMELDMNEFCSKDLMEKIKPARQHIMKRKGEIEEENKRSKVAKFAELDSSSSSAKTEGPAQSSPTTVEPADQEMKENTEADTVIGDLLKDDVGCNPSGMYDLVAVLTHIGRNANSGHYIAWVKKMDNSKSNPDEPSNKVGSPESLWYKFDDDKVSLVNETEIAKLQGGGDWHTAYITLYKAKQL